MKTRRILIPLILIVMIYMSSCAPAATPATQAPAAPAATQAGQAPADSRYIPSIYKGPAATKDNITLRVIRMKWSDAAEAQIGTWNAEFKKLYPNITIQEEVVPFGELLRKIQTAEAAGAPADVINADGPNVKQYAYYKMIMPLEDYLNKSYFDDFLPSTLAEHTYDGKVYATAWQTATLLLYFNKDMLKTAGITFPESTDLKDVMTWDQAMDAWVKLQKDPSGSGNPEVWGLGASEMGRGGPGNYYADGIWIRSYGEPNADKNSSSYKTFWGISDDGTSVEGFINTPEAIEGLTFYQNMYQKAKIIPTSGLPNQFADSKAATYIATDSRTARFKQERPDLPWSVTFIPKGRSQAPQGGSLTWAVSSKTKYPAEAALYLAYLSEDARALEWWKVGGSLPARVSLYDKIEKYQSYPFNMIRVQAINATFARPQTPAFGEYLAFIEPALKDIALGADIKTRIAQAEQEIQQALSKYQ